MNVMFVANKFLSLSLSMSSPDVVIGKQATLFRVLFLHDAWFIVKSFKPG